MNTPEGALGDEAATGGLSLARRSSNEKPAVGKDARAKLFEGLFMSSAIREIPIDNALQENSRNFSRLFRE